MTIVYHEGHFVKDTEATIPVSDRGFQFGDGAFATIQVRNGVPLFLEAHLQQLSRQCASFKLTMPHVERQIIEELIEHNRAFQGIWRMKIIVTGGDHEAIRLPEREGRMIMILKPFTPLPFKPLKMGVFPIPYYTCHASFKSLANLNRFYVMEEAHKQSMDDCVTFTEKGFILEAAFGNLFWVDQKTFFTPDPTLPIYFGITIQNAQLIAQKLGFEVKYVKSSLAELPPDAAAFRTNTMQGIRPIAQIGDVAFSQNLTIQTLFVNGYEQMIEAQLKEGQRQSAVT